MSRGRKALTLPLPAGFFPALSPQNSVPSNPCKLALTTKYSSAEVWGTKGKVQRRPRYPRPRYQQAHLPLAATGDDGVRRPDRSPAEGSKWKMKPAE
ncbi:hypothetical protein ACFX1X_015096 [Malus domestica]|uniref:Uncharacterized protein n=1 Tax=Malus domestica TaxID=3750 RepID=A0A498I7D4_MALDO|nr:hypothetical protein DVH24_040103 [Malus domestica]